MKNLKKILRNTKIISYSKQCDAIIFDLGTVPDFLGSEYVVDPNYHMFLYEIGGMMNNEI